MRFRWLLWLMGVACVPPRIVTPADQVPIVDDVAFRGNGGSFSGTGDYLLRGAMEQQQSPIFWRLAPKRRAVRLDADELYRDAWRIETWYAHHGFFEARFLGWEIVERRPDDGRTPVVTLVGHVEEGPETRITSVEWIIVDPQGQPVMVPGKDGALEEQKIEAAVGKPLANLLRRQAPSQEDERFVVTAHDETKDLTLSKLHDRSFAYAAVTGEVRVDGDAHTARLRYLCSPGPPCRLGEISLEGETRVPGQLVREQIHLRAGDAFSASELARTQRDLFALGTFSVVNVVPELSRPPPLPSPGEGEPAAAPPQPDDVVPIRIEIQDSRWRQLRVGGGVAVENGKQELRASTELQHTNLLNRLLHLDLALQGGYTWLTSWSDVLTVEDGSAPAEEQLSGGPSVVLGLGLDVPRFLHPTLRLENDLGFELGVEPTYQYATPTFGTALAWRPVAHLTLGLGYKLRYFRYFNTIGAFRALSTSGSDLDTQNPYFLSTLTESLVYDSRNDPLFPTRGAYTSLALDQAGPPGMFDFLRVNADGRIYRPMGRLVHRLFDWYPRMTIAGRLGGGWIRPYALLGQDRASVPFAERLYLGGSSSVRGWANDHLGSYAWDCGDGENTVWCSSAPQEALCAEGEACEIEPVPTGGTLSAFGSAELRTWLPGQWEDVGVVLFSDLGMAWPDLSSLREIPPQLSLGGGLRYRTPVGPLRLDVARRGGDLPMFAHEPRWAFYFSLAEAF